MMQPTVLYTNSKQGEDIPYVIFELKLRDTAITAIYRWHSLFAGVTFSEYHAKMKTAENKGQLFLHLIVHIAIKKIHG
jgi:hypothetical protein